MFSLLPNLITTLASNGLGILASAIQIKGKEFVESAINVKIPDNLSQEDLIALKRIEMEKEEMLLGFQIKAKELEISELQLASSLASTEQQNITERWVADSKSESALSKNIRPGTLVYILTAYLLFALMSSIGININEAYVKLLGEWGQLVMLAYFGGRSIEKIFELKTFNKGGG